MQGKFVSNLVLLVFLNLLIKPFYILGIDAEIQNRVGSETYGFYFAVLSFSFLFNVLIDLGITNFNNRAVSRNVNKLYESYSGILGLKLVLFIIYIVVSSAVGLMLNFSNDHWKLLFVLYFNQLLVSLILYFRSNLGALQMFVRDSIVSVLDRLLLIVFFSIVLWGNVTNQPFKIEWLVYGQTVAYFITLIVVWVMQPGRIRLKFPMVNLAFSKDIIKKSFPYALLILLMMVYTRTDSVMLERILLDGGFEAGQYAQGYRLLDAANMFAMLFAVLLLPMFSRMIKKREKVHDLVYVSARMILVFSIPLAVISAVYPERILSLRYEHVTDDSALCFRYLMFSFIGFCTTYIFGTLLTANGSLKQLNIMAMIGISANIVLNLILIPDYGAEGAAIATCITQGLTALIQFGIAQYFFRFSVLRKLLLPILIYTILVVLLTFGFDQMKSSNWTPLYVYAICMVLAWLTGNIHLRPFLNYLKSRNEID